ncbi:MAG: lipoprotein signal peptidase [bacterium]|nr:MAG: lipoprotein signal peptidase [bacterium]
MKKSALVIILVLLLDQALKFYIKLTLPMGGNIPVFGHWFSLYFTENNGMAFGMQFAGSWGKLALSVFRILAITGIGFLLYYLIRRNSSTGMIISMSLIFAGAFGNIIDSAFYGLIFSQSTFHSVATLVPFGHGYAGFLHGKVVDMLYFPLINIAQSDAPSWIPGFLFGPDGHLVFFRPIFDVADASITIGVSWLFLFHGKKLHI